jgi:acetyl esterase/lipase
MRRLILAAGMLVLSVIGAAVQARQDTSGEPRTMSLWEGKAPGALGDAEEDRPTITLYALPKWEPGEIAPEPAIIVFPGGSYVNLAMNHEGRQMANWVNGAGMVAFVVKYRLGPKYHHPVELGDAQRAVRFVRAHAKEFGVDPARVGALGFSAGGHLVSTLETHFDAGDPKAADIVERMSCRPDFAVLAYPVISMSADYSHSYSRENLLGKDATPEMRKALSSELNVRRDTPPTFIFSSSTDDTVPPQNSVAFYSALLAAKVPAELHIFEKAPHGVGMDLADPSVGEWTALMLHWMRGNEFLPTGAE